MPTDSPMPSEDIEQTWCELREGLETSREIVRRSRVLIELSESDRPSAGRRDEEAITN